MPQTKCFDELAEILGAATDAFADLVGYIRTRYVMDELWDGIDELKFRRGGKTLVTLYVQKDLFRMLLIFGKAERAAFEQIADEFPAAIREIYNGSRTYHDGKWMFFDVQDGTLLPDLIRMLTIKRKPNRKPEKIDPAMLGRCGNRCDQCLLHHTNATPENLLRFRKGDHLCYYRPDEPENTYDFQCAGCRVGCAVARCATEHGHSSCRQCNYHACQTRENNFTHPGRCTVGLTHEDVESFILPYCGKEHFDAMK